MIGNSDFDNIINDDRIKNPENEPINDEMHITSALINLVETLQTRICKCSNINMAEVLLMVLQLEKKYSLNWQVILSFLEMLNCIFTDIKLPTTKYTIHKLLNVNIQNVINYHFLCPLCNASLQKMCKLKDNVSCSCGTTVKINSVGSFFIELDIKDQMTKLLCNKTVVNKLFTHRFNSSENKLEDIYDGSVYKTYIKNKVLLNKFNFSYTINTDGCQASDSSKISIWPIYLMLNELPDHMRKNHMILAGLWVAKHEPNMNVFLQPFVDQANELSSTGFDWIYNGRKVVSRLLPLGCCVDSVARCAMLNMKKFNGKYGCTYCEHPSEAVNGVRKYPQQISMPKERTHNSIIEKMILVQKSDLESFMGVKGPSVLMNLDQFDLVDGMILDFMHACLLGVTQLHATIIFTNAKMKYYVGSPNKIGLVNKRLMSIRPPSCIAKIARNISERNLWTASEWLAWLMFYSLICLKDILPKIFYNHLATLVSAINILLEESITDFMLERAREMLITFVDDFESLYGKNFMHYNVHLLLHLCKTVKNWGLLHSINTFPFENQNKLLLQSKHCNYRILQQIVYKLMIFQRLPILENMEIISDKVREFCLHMNDRKLKFTYKVGNSLLIGNGTKCFLSNEEYELCQNLLNVSLEVIEYKSFTKMIFKGYRFTIHQYNKCKRRNDSVIQTINNEFGIITKILKIKSNDSEKVIILFRELFVSNFMNNSINLVTHIKHVNNADKTILRAIDSEMILKPSLITRSGNEFFLITIVKGTLGRYCN